MKELLTIAIANSKEMSKQTAELIERLDAFTKGVDAK